MFNLITKFFGFHSKDEGVSSSESNESAQKLRSTRLSGSSTSASSTSHDSVRPRESSKLGETTMPMTNSRTNMKARSYWSQGYYDRHLEQSPQQQLNLLYAPQVGPITRTGSDTVWNNNEPFGSARQKALNSYLTKSNQEITSAYAEDAQTTSAEQIEQVMFEPNALTDTVELTLPRSTQEILRDMAGHKDIEVRACIAANELTPVEALWALSQDESPMVRLKLVSNMKCPIPLLELLTNDTHSDVALRATNTLRKVWKSRGSAA